MNQFFAFTKKEFYESVATFRLYILLVVFVLFGVMGPMLAILTPAIMEMVAAGDSGITIILPDPTAIDSWTQFFGNFSQMGSLALAVIFAGIMSSELSRGTLVNLLSKGLKRHTVILSKFFSAGVLWTLAITFSVGICWLYTAFYFDMADISHTALVFVAPWLFGLFLIALLVFGGTLFGNFGGSLGVGFGTFLTLVFVNMIPGAERYNPVSLAGGALSVMNGTGEAADFIPAILICVATIVMLLVGSISVFNRKKM